MAQGSGSEARRCTTQGLRQQAPGECKEKRQREQEQVNNTHSHQHRYAADLAAPAVAAAAAETLPRATRLQRREQRLARQEDTFISSRISRTFESQIRGCISAFLALAPLSLVLADSRSLAFLTYHPWALVFANSCHSLLFFLVLVWPLPHGCLTNMYLHARRFHITRLHQATRQGQQ